MIPDEKLIDLRIKHLEMTQSVINRMAAYSTSLKNYCLTIFAALGAASATLKNGNVLLFAAIAILIFATLDAKYLLIERKYRGLYDQVRSGDWTAKTDFVLSVETGDIKSLIGVIASWSVLLFYGPLLFLSGVIVLYLDLNK